MNDLPRKSDFVVVGGVATGPKTAATLARLIPSAGVTLFQRESHLSYATCGFPFFASGELSSFDQLLQTGYGVTRDVEFFEQSKGCRAIPSSEVISINRQKKTVTVKMLQSGETFEHGYGRLVLATGSTPNKPPMPVPDSDLIRPFTRPADVINFRQLAQQGKVDKVVIVGGGFVGIELCEAVRDTWGIEVKLFEKQPQLLPYMLDPEMAAILQRSLVANGVDVLDNAEVEKIELDSDGKPVVYLQGLEPISTDYVFLCLGVRPEVTLAKECGLDIGKTGGILVDSFLQTSDADIFAGGDCVESFHRITKHRFYIPMGSLANRHGRFIAENLAGNKIEFPGVVGTFVLRAFDTNIGGVGLSELVAKQEGLDVRTVWGSFSDKPDYMPEVKTFTLKMIYEEGSNRLLGLQAVGSGDICRRVDVFSSLLQREAELEDLLDFEHGYAPPFAGALDPLHHLAGIALAEQRGTVFVEPKALEDHIDDNTLLLDVREPDEIANEPLPADNMPTSSRVVVIPLNELRKRLDELDRNKRILLVCRRGLRSYQAALILKAAGYKNVIVLAAGLQAQR